MHSTSLSTSSAFSDRNLEELHCMYTVTALIHNSDGALNNGLRIHAYIDRIIIMYRHSQHFFMEVLLTKMHSTADKYASLNKEGTAILFTTRDQPKVKQTISLAEGKRIFEDLYGAIDQRWVVSDEYAALQAKRSKGKAHTFHVNRNKGAA